MRNAHFRCKLPANVSMENCINGYPLQARVGFFFNILKKVNYCNILHPVGKMLATVALEEDCVKKRDVAMTCMPRFNPTAPDDFALLISLVTFANAVGQDETIEGLQADCAKSLQDYLGNGFLHWHRTHGDICKGILAFPSGCKIAPQAGATCVLCTSAFLPDIQTSKDDYFGWETVVSCQKASPQKYCLVCLPNIIRPDRPSPWQPPTRPVH